MRFQSQKIYKKIFLTLTGGIFLFSFFVSSLFPEKAFAMFGAGDTSIDITPPLTPNQQEFLHTKDKVQLTIGQAIKASVLSAAVQGARYFMEKIAYDTAQYIANGGKGQASLLFSKNWDDYLGQVAGDAAGAAVSELGKWAGLDLCKFPDINLQLYLQIGLRQMDAPSTDCTWKDLKATYGKDAWVKRYKNAKSTAQRFDSSDKVLKEFSKAIKPGNTDMGIGVGALLEVDRIKKQREKSAEAERTTNRGFKDLQSLISGRVQTPGAVIQEETTKQLSQVEQGTRNEISLSGIYAAGAVEIIPETAAMFLNTLGTTLLQRLFSQGIVPAEEGNTLAYDYGSDPGVQNTAEAARNAFNFLFARTPTQPTDYNNLAEFSACPDNPGINNCVMDSGLQEAISRSSVDNPITIGQAKALGLLNPNWPLISPRRLQENQNIKGCVSEKYCYSNIQKLRKARILPLGFEIAALRSDPDQPWTLGQVIDGFDDCTRDPNNPLAVIPDPNKPFCHLINPNWVIKAPTARCDIKVYGDLLSDPSISARREECADVSTCLGNDNTGACAQFGYCTKESNVWRIPGDSCPAEFNTCTTFVDVDSKKITSYLAKTVDYGECSAENVGCRAYSLVGPTTSWKNSASIDMSANKRGNTQVIYFNKNIQSLSAVCNESNNGCSDFYGAVRSNNGSYLDLNTTTRVVEFALDKINDPLHIKKAPEYLGCYDKDRATAGIQWPTSSLEASVAGNSSASCDKFASACVPEEVGCEEFKPKDGGPIIPGKIGDKNFCDVSCVGYETFKQEPTHFENQKFPVYFIPSQAVECPAIAAGCSEFTNIDAQSSGGEGIEYYTNLKYCEKPAEDRSNIKVFYSWEGSADNGYVLRTYEMKPLAVALNRPGFEVGSPAYILDADHALDEFTALCDETKYNKLITNGPGTPQAADANCKALFDKDGHTYYRLLDKTVSVDPSCHPLRKTEAVFEVDINLDRDACMSKSGRWNENTQKCDRCINGGKFQNGFCVYQTISRAGESTSCAPEYKGCRAYSGNAVGNIVDVFSSTGDDFEPGSEDAQAFSDLLSDWAPSTTLRVVGEAPHTGDHSLEVPLNTAARRNIALSSVNTNEWYQLSFLAKSNGASQNIYVGFKQNNSFVGAFTSPINPIQLGNDWQLYTVGPIQFTGNTSDTISLSFERGAAPNSIYFLDQVRLRRINDYKHYIKDSWKNFPGNEGRNVPFACDSAPEDALPGEALGCREYTDSTNISRYATGFQNLCREKAIGCQPVWDTFNTVNGNDADLAQVFNVLCTANPGTTCQALYQNKELGSCFVPAGATNCSIPQIIVPSEITFDALSRLPGNRIAFGTSTVFIPQDTPSTTPIFLATGEKQKYVCDGAATGCLQAGQEERHLPNIANTSFSFNDLFVKNDPESYKDTLCRNDLVGCSHYKNGDKETYFKDPEITGNSLCAYRPPTEGISSQSGWFLKDIGKCANNASQICRTDVDCDAGIRCENIGSVACSPDNIKVGGFVDIWSNKSPKYKGNVGVCPATYNACTELIDHQDTSELNPDGKPYYVIFNQKIEDKKKDCTQVSLRDGCVLFDKTDEPNKVFDAAATYARSESRVDQPYGPVDAIRAGDPAFRKATTNLLLKVNRDRECSEWLACKSYASSVSYEGGARRETQICSQLAACDKIGVGGTCANWIDPRSASSTLSRLTYDKYLTRGVSWYDTEFSGYSLYNKYQISDMIYLKFNFPTQELRTLMSDEMSHTYIVRQLRQSILDKLGGQNFDCKPNPGENTDWQTCGYGDNQINGGRCYANQCVYPTNGSFPTNIVIDIARDSATESANKLKLLISALEPNSCKGTPEIDSPYPDKILKVGQGEQILVNPESPGQRRNTAFKLEGFSAANACQFGACSCAYQKFQYGGGQQDYWPLIGLKSGTVIPEGICSGGGKKDTRPCMETSDCIDNKGTVSTEDDEFGSCNLRQNVQTQIGLEGYCLEYDLSRPIFYNGENSFACLTWLPVNISASAVDIYNTDVSAGYNLRDDAPNGGGQVYCSQSTHTGWGVEDENMTKFDAVEGGKTSYFAANFFSTGRPILHYYYQCGDPVFGHGDEPRVGYVDHLCRSWAITQAAPDPDAPKLLYTDVYSWLAHETSLNSTILRMEWGAPQGGLDDDEPANSQVGSWGIDINNGSEEDVRRMYSFAPTLNGEGGNYSLGTIMHPPRTFSNVNLNETVFARQSEIINPQESVKASELHFKIYGNAAGLEGEAGVRGGRLYRSPYEKYLHENDLSKVIFITMAYPGGVNSEAPSLFQPDYAIDFDRLRQPGLIPADAVLLLDSAIEGNSDNQLLSEPKDSRDTVLWTYRLDDISQSNFAFKDYRHFNQDGNDAELKRLATDERNRIQTRYVAVWSDWIAAGEMDMTPNFLTQHVPIDSGEHPEILRGQVVPPQPNSEPFSAPCTSQSANWLAIGMDFNKDGEFLGYISRWCNAESGDDGMGIQIAVGAVLHDRCTNFDQVYKSDQINALYDTTNKAFTNRVWSGAKELTGAELGPRKLDAAAPWNKFLRDTLQTPYASSNLTELDLLDYKKLRNYVFRSKEDGLPYICGSDWLGSTAGFRGGQCSAFLLLPYESTFVEELSDIGYDDSIAKFDSIFAEIWKTISVDTSHYEAGTGVGPESDFFADDADQVGRSTAQDHRAPPIIYSLNPSRCENKDKCTAAESDTITINSRNGTLTDYNQDGLPDEPDEDNNGVADPIIASGGVYSAEAKFFAFADDDHMPIRQVMVDWDEQELAPVNQFKKGLYKNRKPLCGISNEGGLADVGICEDRLHHSTGLTCSTDQPCPTGQTCVEPGTAQSATGLIKGTLGDDYKTIRFGNTPRACVNDYYIFVHQYSCGPSNLDTRNAVLVKDLLNPNLNQYFDNSFTQGIVDQLTDTYGLQENETDYVCVFKPRVQVTDNWGWCNGSCSKDYDANGNPVGQRYNGCYNEMPIPGGGVDHQCGVTVSDQFYSPWLEYGGSIIVIPNIDD